MADISTSDLLGPHTIHHLSKVILIALDEPDFEHGDLRRKTSLKKSDTNETSTLLRSIFRSLLASIFFFLPIIFFSASAFAQFELGATANYRKSLVDNNNFQESLAYTGSISYYLFEMSAIELSYTAGATRFVIQPGADLPKNTTTITFDLIGADLVFSFGTREDAFQPYFKAGVGHIRKEIRRSIEGGATTQIGVQEGMVPSAGLGFKLMLTQSFAIKVGLDAWTSPLDQDVFTVDYAGRAGLSWYL